MVSRLSILRSTPSLLELLQLHLLISLAHSVRDSWNSCEKWNPNHCINEDIASMIMQMNCKNTCRIYKSIPDEIARCIKENTCGGTDIGEIRCKDRLSSCGRYKKHCSSSRSTYRNYMKENCQQTCGLCPKPKPRCYDAGPACTYWKPVCTGFHYSEAVRDLCPKTCGTCKSSEGFVFEKSGCGRVAAVDVLGSIVGGSVSAPYRWRWQGALYVRGTFQCGGSLIARNLFVTAAHCVHGRYADELTVVLGEFDRGKDEGWEQIRRVGAIEKHPYYHRKHSWYNDIALLKLKKNVHLNEKVGLVCLPEENEEPTSDMKCYITGWGKNDAESRTGTQQLNEARLHVIPMKRCLQLNRELTLSTSNRLCGGDVDRSAGVSACSGDSGGPYVCQRKDSHWVLQGIVSYGSNSCDSRNRNTVFTKVSKYVKWLSETAAKI